MNTGNGFVDVFKAILAEPAAILIISVASVGVFAAFFVGRKAARSALQVDELIKSRDFFLTLFEESPVPYMMIEKDGTILLPNKAAQRLFERTKDELRQYKFYQLHEEHFLVESRQIHEKFIRGVTTADTEIQIAKKDGTIRWVRMSAYPFKNSKSKDAGGVISMLDITEQKAVDRVKTEFVSLASHQLRTPLTAMKWYGEMLLDSKEGLSQKQKKHAYKIYNANERMIGLVNLLLSASRLELGTLKIDIGQVDPVVTANELLEELRKEIQDKDLHIIQNYAGDHTNYYSDKKLVRMIMQNLLSNAVKYTQEGGRITLTLQNDNDQLKIVVEDTGLGIPKEQQSKIFTKMFRADNARLSVIEGTGLGLYIVKEAVESLSGEIQFTSVENEGTIFTVVLPNGTHGNITETKNSE